MSIRERLDGSHNAMVIVDERGCITDDNAVAREMFGYGPWGMGDHRIEDLIPERFRDAHIHHRDAYRARPVARGMGCENMPLFGRRKDGSEFRAQVSLEPVGREVIATIRYAL